MVHSNFNFVVVPSVVTVGFTRTLCDTLESAEATQRRFYTYVYMEVYDKDGNRVYTAFDKEIGEAPAEEETKPQTEEMPTVRNGSVIALKSWNLNDCFERAMVHDMGLDASLGTTDANCLYGSARALFLSSNTGDYERDEKRYANPLILNDGDMVRLNRNGKIYRVKNMGYRGKFAYYTDILHFELIK